MPPTRIERWRSPLVMVTLAGLLLALLTGSVLLFFAMPRELRHRRRELYDVLAAFYRQDPAEREIEAP